MKKVLIIGSGGREHALAWKLAQSEEVAAIFVAPGNAGTAQVGKNIPINADNIEALANFAKKNDIDLTVVGPDQALASGIVDFFSDQGLKIFGPTRKAAEIEWSKVFAKDLMKKYDIPTAQYETFISYEKGLDYLKSAAYPLVVKASGLAAGKGVIICQNRSEAEMALQSIMQRKEFGSSGDTVVIEEYLEGIEVSAHALCDREKFLLFPLAQDHKRIGEGNTGPNTGGMGTICPVPEPITEIGEIVAKILSALTKEGRPFTGCLFPGIMLTAKGPKVLECNARFGDPETQVYMRLLKDDLYPLLESVSNGRLSDKNLQWHSGAAACIVLASAGYPAQTTQGEVITGLEKNNDPIVTFHAGTKEENGQIVTNGGRVLNVTSTGVNLTSALQKAYDAVDNILFKGKRFRKDIGLQYSDGRLASK